MRAQVTRDGTIDVHFHDGSELAIIPRSDGYSTRVIPTPRVHTDIALDGGDRGRALVLEPFAAELNRGSDPGRAEANALTSSGFTVDVLTNADVTIPAMEKLANYSVVYMETHSHQLADGGAVIATGDTDNRTYASLFTDHSLIQVFVAGDAHMTLYDGITSVFLAKHTGTFPPSSIVFLNGCGVLAGPRFWAALQGQGVSTLISWDGDAGADITDRAATVLLNRMAAGDTVSTALTAVVAAGLGSSTMYNPTIHSDVTSHIGLAGDAANTLSRALIQTLPTATPTTLPTPTLTPIPTPTPRPPKHKKHCKKGYHVVHGKCRKVKKKHRHG